MGRAAAAGAAAGVAVAAVLAAAESAVRAAVGAYVAAFEEDSAEGRTRLAGRSIALLLRREGGEWRIANLPGQ